MKYVQSYMFCIDFWNICFENIQMCCVHQKFEIIVRNLLYITKWLQHIIHKWKLLEVYETISAKSLGKSPR